MASEPELEPDSIGPETYNKFLAFENAESVYRIPISSPLSSTFSTLSGPEKITYLKTHGQKTTKRPESERGRIMIHHSGAWIFWNEGQIEYMVPCEDEFWKDTQDAEEFARLSGEGKMKGEVRREWVVSRAVRIREWPDHIKRVQSIDLGKAVGKAGGAL